MPQLEAGKWYVSNINPPKGGVQGIGMRPGAKMTTGVVSPGFDTEEAAAAWLAEHPEFQGSHAKVFRQVE